jgi:NADPH-dependent curcumin reductase CurA
LSRAFILAARPEGEPKASDFEVQELEDGEPGDGEVLVRNVFVSVDPYMRGRMTGVRTYIPPYELGDVINGASVGRVVASKDARFAEGDWVNSMLGWREGGVASGDSLIPVDPAVAPPSTALGVLGMPAFTAWIGLDEIGRIAEGESVFVSGAAGAVGSAAAQIALLRGCRVLGSAGSPEKVEWLRSLGVEAFDYRTADLKAALADGIDVYFDNVGGVQLEAALTALRTQGRVVACGGISRYNAVAAEPGPRNFFLVVTKRLRIQGFIIFDHNRRFPEFQAEVGAWVREGKLAYRETIVDGFENLPQAFVGLFHGDNVGKMLVRVSPDEL